MGRAVVPPAPKPLTERETSSPLRSTAYPVTPTVGIEVGSRSLCPTITVSDAVTLFAACFAIVLIFIAGEKLVIDPFSRGFQLR